MPFPRECIEDQGRAVNNIMKCIDASLKSLIVFPHSDTIKSQNNIQKVQGSFALACLMRNIYGQDHTAIPKQLQQLQDRAKQYATTVDMPKFKREFQTERAIYNKMVQLFGRRQDIERKKSEIEICEILLSEVYLQDKELAKTLKRRLEAKPPLTLEELLTTLVENRIMEEGLGESPVAKRGTGSSKSADKKDSKQSVANPAIQQQTTCPVCKGAHDISTNHFFFSEEWRLSSEI